MKLTRHDWEVLRPSLVVLGVVVCAGLLLLGYSGKQKDSAMQALQVQQNLLEQAHHRLQTAGAEKNRIDRFMPLYLQLVRQGSIGEARRLEWIDALRTINEQHKLFGISYSIGAQESYRPPFSLAMGVFALHRSSMKIEAPLLHEGDLLTILNALASVQRAPFVLRDCVICRTVAGAKNKFAPNLQASCEIDWLSVTEPLVREGRP